ncbi:MAG: hypothetical protein Ct9H300mP16_19410 [Pseudomonadota bacterium]|nr:MAG: hypothetical protein Ct9H300mP16_19410 [Pseudomonadota bacterium]
MNPRNAKIIFRYGLTHSLQERGKKTADTSIDVQPKFTGKRQFRDLGDRIEQIIRPAGRRNRNTDSARADGFLISVASAR